MPRTKDDTQLPLFNLYIAVKGADQEMGHSTVDLQSYLLLLETLQRGYMVNSKEELFFLCEKLWLKPYHTAEAPLNVVRLRELFDREMQAVLEENRPPVTQPKRVAPEVEIGKQAPPVGKPGGPGATATGSMDKQKQQLVKGELSIKVSVAGGEEKLLPSPSEELRGRLGTMAYLVKGVYLPVPPRRIEQSVRSLRYRKKGTGKWQIDWPATIEDVAQKGYFDLFVFREQDAFYTDWMVLIDNSASMAAFSPYSSEIARAVARGNSDEDEAVFYFKNYPTGFMYKDDRQAEGVPFERWVKGAKKNILIISDAGAARGVFSEERIKASYRFLERLHGHRVAWINPMPRMRWRGSSAEIIAYYTDMFDIGEGSIDNLNNIVRLFKSKFTTEKA